MNIYDYQRPVGKIQDDVYLRNEFISLYEVKSHKDMARFGLHLGKHIISITGIEPCEEIIEAFGAVNRWLEGKANYSEARNIDIYKYARAEKDALRQKFYKTMAQIACIPHVKYHALWATDFAVTLINKMHPDNFEEVKKERAFHIESLKKANL